MQHHLVMYIAIATAVFSTTTNYLGYNHKIEFSDFFTIAGTIITSISFAFAAYFLILTKNAYSQANKVEEIYNKTINALNNQKKLHKKQTNLTKKTVYLIDDFIGHFILVNGHSINNECTLNIRESIRNRNKRLYRQRSLLAVNYPYFNENQLFTRINALWVFGEKTDIPVLEKFISGKNNSVRIKKLCEAIIDKLKGPSG